MFVWVVHRVSGSLLIVLLGLKLATGFSLMTRDAKPEWALALHVTPIADVTLIILLVFHAAYGLRTIIHDLGVSRDRALFWSTTALAVAASAALLSLYYTRNY
jgi:succinate dehydrogenase/fumarate reductase cytochrome b subunit